MDLEEIILDLVTKSPAGITNKSLQSANLSPDITKIVGAINKLTSTNKIQICHKGKELVYVPTNKNTAKVNPDVDVEEKVIFQLIEKAGNKGIWMRDLRVACNLPQALVGKALKTLESKKLIKSVASVSASKKKVYMLYELEPDRSVSGGTWYSDQEFEAEFVDVLTEQCLRYLSQFKADANKLSDPLAQQSASSRTVKDVCDFINGLQVSKVELSLEDIQTILDTLVYDGKVEKVQKFQVGSVDSVSVQHAYRITNPLVTSCALMRIPCGTCPVQNECRIGGIISPTTCTYMREWLEF